MSGIAEAIFEIAPQFRDGATFSSNHMMMRCPFHKAGQERTPSMSVSTEKPVFMCFGCGESGHISRLLRSLGLGKDSVDIILRSTGMDVSKPAKKGKVATKVLSNINPFRGRFILDEDLLDAYRMAPGLLLTSGFEKKTLRHFEVGFDKMNLRITFPLRNVYGELVGISGRAVLDQEPRYKIYDKELKTRTDFNVPEDYTMDEVKETLMWHAHIVKPILFRADEPLVLTEGFKACMWVWQTAYQSVTALIGAYLTDYHLELIAANVKTVVLFLDNNFAGHKGTFWAGEKLISRGREVLVARYPDEREQPDALQPEETRSALANYDQYITWRERHGRRFIHENAVRARSRNRPG